MSTSSNSSKVSMDKIKLLLQYLFDEKDETYFIHHIENILFGSKLGELGNALQEILSMLDVGWTQDMTPSQYLKQFFYCDLLEEDTFILHYLYFYFWYDALERKLDKLDEKDKNFLSEVLDYIKETLLDNFHKGPEKSYWMLPSKEYSQWKRNLKVVKNVVTKSIRNYEEKENG